MTDRSRVSRRRVLRAIATVGGASAAAGAGTMAHFSETESSNGNTVQAGTLDLTLNGANQTVTFLDVGGIAPGDDGSQSITLGNDGTVLGTIEIILEDVRDYENGIVNNESSYDSPGDGGELQEYIDVRVSIGGTVIVGRQSLASIQSVSMPYTYQTGVGLAAQASKQFTVEWWFNDPGDKTVNEAQSDSVELDISFRLVST